MRIKTREHKLIDVARGKPVIYLETPLVQDGKILNQRHNYERYSVNAGSYPSRLTDGSRNTKVYPASWFFDYIIDLEDTLQVKEIRLVWGMYGKEPDYITEWRLYSQTDFSDAVEPAFEKQWVLVEKGEVPGSEETLIKRDITARRFRIGAASIDQEKGLLLNWIGMTAFEAYVEAER
ncbi:MAG: hypothetical protein AB1512_17975 [Thermodesulfobacteriota bacterium]